MKLINVANRPDLRKDISSGVIFFNNDSEKRKHSMTKDRIQNRQDLREEVDQLKNDLADIKTMLATLINK
jgi:hypothetical protein